MKISCCQPPNPVPVGSSRVGELSQLTTISTTAPRRVYGTRRSTGSTARETQKLRESDAIDFPARNAVSFHPNAKMIRQAKRTWRERIDFLETHAPCRSPGRNFLSLPQFDRCKNYRKAAAKKLSARYLWAAVAMWLKDGIIHSDDYNQKL